MGLIKALSATVGGTLADQWKEFFYCEALSPDVLAVKGKSRVSGRSSNTGGNENIISHGSKLAVADGQCAVIVEQGMVVELCASPGEYTYDKSTEPSIFTGNSLGESAKAMFEEMKRRFTYGGDTGKDQRIYYFNMKEIVGNKYGTQNPVPFRVVDKNIGLDIDIAIRCNGEYSYKLINPMLFYKNVCGNVEKQYSRGELDSQLKSELLTALQPAFAKISAQGIRYSALPGHTQELADALNEALSAKWRDLRGIAVAVFGINSVTASKEDEDMIKQLQKSASLRDPTMAAAALTGAQADAMRAAAANEGGAMLGFMGLGMAHGMGSGLNTKDLYAMGREKAAAGPPPAAGWTCACGAVNKGKFCAECGTKKPAGALLYACDKCGWQPPDPEKPPKFCPECGDIFDGGDARG